MTQVQESGTPRDDELVEAYDRGIDAGRAVFESERDRYREALERISNLRYEVLPEAHHMRQIAREALDG